VAFAPGTPGDRSSYRGSQIFGEAVRASADDGIIYDSLRHIGGTNVVCYRPRKILDVRQAEHFELTVPIRGHRRARAAGSLTRTLRDR
jgi:hypothetical protein